MTHEELAAIQNAREFLAGKYKPGSTLDVKYAKPMVASLFDMLCERGLLAEPLADEINAVESDEDATPEIEPQPE